MLAARVDLTIEPGARFRRVFVWKTSYGAPQNLSGYEARMHVRRHYDDPTPEIEATTANGMIEVVAQAGQVIVDIPATETRKLRGMRRGVYSLEMVPGGNEAGVVRLAEGVVYVNPEATW